MKIKGKLIIIGGGEDKGTDDDKGNFTGDSILKRFIQESAGKEKSIIEIITTASTVQEEIGRDYRKAFKKLGAENTGTLNINTREEADNPEVIKRLEKADAVFFTGGDQMRLTTILGGTLLYKTLVDRLETEPTFLYAGTSAGAAAASETMIDQGSSTDAILKGEIVTSTGFGFVDNIVFDTHFIKRGRIGRLFQIIVTNPTILGVGLEENTGLLIHNTKMEAIGPGMTIIIDGQDIKNSNLLEIKAGAPISIDNLRLHVMSRTDVFDLKNRSLKIMTPDECRL
jgi:cyanophycinase